MTPFTLQPVVITPDWNHGSWQARVDDAVAGRLINAAMLVHVDTLQHELVYTIEAAGGILRASDDQLFALLKLRAYRRQCVEAGVKDSGTSPGGEFPTPADLLNIILGD